MTRVSNHHNKMHVNKKMKTNSIPILSLTIVYLSSNHAHTPTPDEPRKQIIQ
jgi:hypothetical protein